MLRAIDDFIRYIKIQIHLQFNLGDVKIFNLNKKQKIFIKEVVELWMSRGQWWDIIDYPTDGTSVLLKWYGIVDRKTKREDYKGRKEIMRQNEEL